MYMPRPPPQPVAEGAAASAADARLHLREQPLSPPASPAPRAKYVRDDEPIASVEILQEPETAAAAQQPPPAPVRSQPGLRIDIDNGELRVGGRAPLKQRNVRREVSGTGSDNQIVCGAVL
jgi:hypothetical protein